MTAAGPPIVTRALPKDFRARSGVSLRAVDHLDLEIHPGEIFGLLGPNGAGKTTTVGMLTTRVIPTAGSAFVGGVDVVAHPARAKQVIGVVPQTSTLDRSLDVIENLVYHGRYFGMGRHGSYRRAEELLDRFRLMDRARADTVTLSGGMAQRVQIARALMHRPQVLFLDEPTAGLDPQSRLALWEVIGELHDAGQTILLTTHYMEEADQLCDRVAIMDQGRLLALDTPGGLKQSIGADTEVRVSADGDLAALAESLRVLDDVNRVTVTDGSVLAFARASVGLLSRVIRASESAGFAVHDVGITEPTLETVFIGLTGKDLRE